MQILAFYGNGCNFFNETEGLFERMQNGQWEMSVIMALLLQALKTVSAVIGIPFFNSLSLRIPNQNCQMTLNPLD